METATTKATETPNLPSSLIAASASEQSLQPEVVGEQGEEACRAQLAEAEVIIRRGRDTFIEVGEALLKIAQLRLYRYADSGYRTFEDYCRERWGFSRQHAHRLIVGYGVAENLSPQGDTATLSQPINERQTRELSRLTPDQQRELAARIDLAVIPTHELRREVEAILHPPPSAEERLRLMDARGFYRAQLLYQYLQDKKFDTSELAQLARTTVAEIEATLHARKMMLSFFMIDNGKYAKQGEGRWGYFEAFVRSRTLRELAKEDVDLEDNFCRWVGDDRIPDVASVSKLSLILSNKLAAQTFRERPPNSAFAEALAAAKAAQQPMQPAAQPEQPGPQPQTASAPPPMRYSREYLDAVLLVAKSDPAHYAAVYAGKTTMPDAVRSLCAPNDPMVERVIQEERLSDFDYPPIIEFSDIWIDIEARDIELMRAVFVDGPKASVKKLKPLQRERLDMLCSAAIAQFDATIKANAEAEADWLAKNTKEAA